MRRKTNSVKVCGAKDIGKVQLLLYLAIIASFFLCSCGQSVKVGSDEFIIHGKLKNTRGETLYLIYLGADTTGLADSAVIDEEGSFTINVKTNNTAFYSLRASESNMILFLCAPGEDISLNANYRQLGREYTVKGSPGSELLMELDRFSRTKLDNLDSLEKALRYNHDTSDYAALKHQSDSLVALIYSQQQDFNKKFIDRNPTSLASLAALYQMFGRAKVLNERDHFEYFLKLDKSLSAVYPGSPYCTELHERVLNVQQANKEMIEAEKKLDSGMIAPDIFMNNIAGIPVSLSAYKGRPVLVYFWAGWSFESQKPIPVYKMLHRKYRSRGFEIIGVSLDRDRQTWEDAVRDNKLEWTQLSDLKEWESPVAKTWCLKSVPSAVLLDRDNRIVKRNITEDELVQRLYKMYRF